MKFVVEVDFPRSALTVIFYSKPCAEEEGDIGAA
jgi:hypothetical protein